MSTMVTSPKGNGVFMVGCKDLLGDSDDIYEMVTDSSGHMSWRIYKSFKYPRTNLITMLIPDEFTTCS